MILVWTRASARWSEDQPLFQSFRGDYLHLPCIRSHRLHDPDLTAPKKPYVAVVSSMLAAEILLSLPRGRRCLEFADMVYVLSDRVASLLQTAGISATFFESARSMADLAKRISHETFLPVFCPGAEKRAFDLRAWGRHCGRQVILPTLYRTESLARDAQGEPASEAERKRLLSHEQIVVCFASPSAVRGFTDFIGETGLARCAAVCIGDTTAASCSSHFSNIHVAREFSIPSLFHTATGQW